MNNNDDFIEIDLAELFSVLLHKAWIIILSMIVCGAIGFCLSKFVIPEKFESTTSIYVQAKSNGETITYSDTQLASQLTNDYQKLITDRYVLERVIEFNKLDSDYEHFSKQVKVTNLTNTRILEITVKDEDPKLAQKLANSIREFACKHIKEVTNAEAVNVVNEANLPTKKSEPSVTKYTAIALAIGFMLSVGIIFLVFYFDDTIKNSDDVEKYLGLSTLAMIPKESNKKK